MGDINDYYNRDDESDDPWDPKRPYRSERPSKDSNPYSKYISPNLPKTFGESNVTYDYVKKDRKPSPADVAWAAVKQVWEDCKEQNYDYEDTCEALYSVVEEIINSLEKKIIPESDEDGV